MISKEERLKNSIKRHELHSAEVDTNVATSANELAYHQKVRAAYYLCHLVSGWIRVANVPKNKLTMDAVKEYAWRLYGRK